LREAALFGGLLVGFFALRYLAHRWVGRRTVSETGESTEPAWIVWLGRAFIGAVVVAAVVTHSLRDAREAQLETARDLVGHGQFQAGLEALARAEPWPSSSKPGRIDYVRAEAYAGMGDRRHAEAHYLRAYQADRTYFWTVADLALFYASSDESLAERRRLAAPYLSRLRAVFAGHPALPHILSRVQRKLAAPQPRGAPDSSPKPDEASPAPARSDE
jgi:hypothetical protein